MSSKGYRNGMFGVYQVAAELTRRGFIVSLTSRGAFGADLLVTDQKCRNAWSVQVKTNGKPASFRLCNRAACKLRSKSHMYVFVNVRNGGDERSEFYVVPSRIVASFSARRYPKPAADTFYAFYKRDKFKDRWQAFGSPEII